MLDVKLNVTYSVVLDCLEQSHDIRCSVRRGHCSTRHDLPGPSPLGWESGRGKDGGEGRVKAETMGHRCGGPSLFKLCQSDPRHFLQHQGIL